MSANEAWFHRLKAAQRDLIRLCGGIERAAEIASLSATQMGRMNNPKDSEIMTIPVIIALEAECQQAPVTAIMANLNGRRLTDPEEERTAATNILSSYSEMKRTAADLDMEMALSMADGNFTPSELQRVDQVAAKKQDALSDLRAALAAGKATGGTRAALKIVGSED